MGIHLIWTCYGTWLPGDPDKPGHWSPLFDLYGRLRAAGHQINLPDATTFEYAKSIMRESPKILTAEERAVVADVIGRHMLHPQIAPGLPGGTVRDASSARNPDNHPPQAAGYMVGDRTYRKPRCHAAAIEPTHVHLLLGPVEEDIARFVFPPLPSEGRGPG